MSSELSSTLISLELLDSVRPKLKGGGGGQVGGCPALFILCIKYSVWHEGVPPPRPCAPAPALGSTQGSYLGPSRRQSDSV